MSTVSPQPMTIDDVFQTVEQSGGGPQLTPPPPQQPGVLTEWTDEIMAEDTSERECPHDDIGIRPRAGTIEMSEDRVPTRHLSPAGRTPRAPRFPSSPAVKIMIVHFWARALYLTLSMYDMWINVRLRHNKTMYR